MAQRIYVPFMLFNARIVNMQHLWEPSFEYQGKKQDKASYFTTCVSAKTRPNWWEEPALAPCWGAYSEVLQKSGMTPQMVSEWPIKDGDMPPEPGKDPSEWAKGHWVFGGSTTNPIKVEMVQGGNVIPLINKVGVKPGDYVALGLTAAIKANNARALKHYCNTVLFMGAGEEIAVGQSVSGAELMRMAQQQGLNPAGFSASPGGFGGGHAAPGPGSYPGAGGAAPQQGGFPGAGGPAAPQGGFPGAGSAHPGYSPQQQHGGPASGFVAPGGPGQMGAPQPGFPQGPAGGPAPGTTTFPSNNQFPGAPGNFPQ